MGSKRPLSEEEIWDDSALLQSWDDALEEYKHYHSLHAKGERVEDVLKKADEMNGLQEETEDGLDLAENVDTTMNMDAEDGQVFEHEPPVLPEEALKNEQAQPAATQSNPPSAPSLLGLPQTLVGMSGNDEALKNLMMSWYYAGYYTGLHEGQQKAHDALNQYKQ